MHGILAPHSKNLTVETDDFILIYNPETPNSYILKRKT